MTLKVEVEFNCEHLVSLYQVDDNKRMRTGTGNISIHYEARRSISFFIPGLCPIRREEATRLRRVEFGRGFADLE